MFVKRKRRIKRVPKLPPITAIKVRWRTYVKIRDHNAGTVPCWVCGTHVPWKHPSDPELSASLEHVIALADGGTHDDYNLSISHVVCNRVRGRGRRVDSTFQVLGPADPGGAIHGDPGRAGAPPSVG